MKLTGYTARHGIDADAHSATLIVNTESRVAHVAARPTHTDYWNHEAITACDTYFDRQHRHRWWRPGRYSPGDIVYVLEQAEQISREDVSFKSLCRRCVKLTLADTGLNLEALLGFGDDWAAREAAASRLETT